MSVFQKINPLFETSEVSVGQHFYWQIGGYEVHGQVLLTSWLVFCDYCKLVIVSESQLKVFSARRIAKFYRVYY